MPDIPSRDALAGLLRAANAVIPTAVVGLARPIDDQRIGILYAYALGMGGQVLSRRDTPEVLLPGTEVRQAAAAEIAARADRAVEWHFTFLGVKRVLSMPVPATPSWRVWFGLASDVAPGADELSAFAGVGRDGTAALSYEESAEQVAERLHRLEIAAEFLPAIGRVLDVRQVFDRLSAISKDALPHDMVVLGLLSDDLMRLTLYAATAEAAQLGAVSPMLYPAAFTRVWDFDMVDDLASHPLERDRPPRRLGMQSIIRTPIRSGDRLVGGLAFASLEQAKYASADIAIARRLSDYVAVALSHHELSEESRRAVVLREQAARNDLLDEVLATVTGFGSLPDVFDRISSVSQRVLTHEGLVLTVLLPGGQKGRVYASTLKGAQPPDIIDVPPAVRANPAWEFDIVQDLSADPVQQGLWIAQQGYRSALRVPIRLDNEFVAGLSFLARAPGAYTQADVPMAKRIADRLALSFSRERNATLLQRVDEAAQRASHLEARVRALTEELDARTGYRRVVGDSPEWRQVLTQATQVAATDATVLLLGESGTGKEVVARFIHRGSRRANSPFLALNCAALPEQLLEAELFGYERGAYTGATQSKPGQLELASGGTLFLDEVGEMSLPAQAKFLRVLQEREFQRLGGTRVLRTDARVVAATNRDLPRAIANGQFREDLYYRLNVFAIRLPSLRERPADVLPLSDAFLADIGRGLGRPPAGISRDARQMLIDYQWPGNVRELRNILERAAILCEGGLITGEHLALNVVPPPPAIKPPPASVISVPSAPPAMPTSAADLHSMERAMIEQALHTARFNKSKAAKALGLTRQQLYVRMHKYGLE